MYGLFIPFLDHALNLNRDLTCGKIKKFRFYY